MQNDKTTAALLIYKLRTIKLIPLFFLLMIETALSGVSIPKLSSPIHSQPDLTISELNSVPSTGTNCGNNQQAQQLAQLIKSSKNQQRQLLTCNKKLNEIAAIKANLIQQNQDVWHNAGHMTPNQLLRYHGFNLPQTYPIFGNQVEAIAGGLATHDLIFEGFLNSPTHRPLLLGEKDFFKQQDQLGVAYVKDLSTEHKHYWVVIIAAQENQITEHNLNSKAKLLIKSSKRQRFKKTRRSANRNKSRRQLR